MKFIDVNDVVMLYENAYAFEEERIVEEVPLINVPIIIDMPSFVGDSLVVREIVMEFPMEIK